MPHFNVSPHIWLQHCAALLLLLLLFSQFRLFSGWLANIPLTLGGYSVRSCIFGVHLTSPGSQPTWLDVNEIILKYHCFNWNQILKNVYLKNTHVRADKAGETIPFPAPDCCPYSGTDLEKNSSMASVGVKWLSVAVDFTHTRAPAVPPCRRCHQPAEWKQCKWSTCHLQPHAVLCRLLAGVHDQSAPTPLQINSVLQGAVTLMPLHYRNTTTTWPSQDDYMIRENTHFIYLTLVLIKHKHTFRIRNPPAPVPFPLHMRVTTVWKIRALAL